MKSKYFDCHTHSTNSSDAHAPMEGLFEAAVVHGLLGIAVTDHYDYYTVSSLCGEDYVAAVAGSVAEYQRIQASGKFAGKLETRLGIELGEATHNIPRAEEVLATGDFDFTLASQHALRDEEDFCFWDYEGVDLIRSFDRMYHEMLEILDWGKFDILSHINYPLRYSITKAGKSVGMEPFKEVLTQLFTRVAQAGKGIEINTSGLRQGAGCTFPSLEYFKLYKACGGEIVTMGSDAHCVEHVAADFDIAAAILREAGFNYAAYYTRHQPTFYKL